MRNSTRLGLLFFILFSFARPALAQSVLNPADPVITYDSLNKPAQPPYGQIGKWVRTLRMIYWNTNDWKCYIYKGVPFRLKFPKTYNPTANDGKKYPMMVFWHGRGEAAETIYDNEFHLLHGGDIFMNAVNDGKFDGYVIAMQTLLPNSGFFVSGHYQMMKELIDYMVQNNKLDPFRIVDNGLSAGGMASLDMFLAYPTYVAGAIACSPPGNYGASDIVTKIKFLPVWYSNGELDNNPSPYTADQVKASMDTAGANFRRFFYPQTDHGTWYQTWADSDFYPFLNRAYSSNPWPLFGKTDFKTTETINVTIGLTAGFDGYQWRRNGTLISGATGNTIKATQTGTYDARVLRGTLWSDWSKVPVVIKTVTGTTTPPPTTTTTIRIEAENYSAMSGVQTEVTLDNGGGRDVGWIDMGDWMDFSVNVPAAGTYTVNLRVATPNNGAQLQIKKSDGTILNTANLPNTGGYQNWQTTTSTATLAAGQQTLRIQSSNAALWNINWLELVGTTSSDTTTTPTTPTTPTNPPVATDSTRIQAEAYTKMSGVQTEVTLDAGGGQDVGWIDMGDWMEYTVNPAAAGTYTAKFRVATPNTGAQLQVRKADGTLLQTVNLPNTGGYQNWQTATASVTLAAGAQTIRIQSSNAALWNINWIQFNFASSTTVTPPPTDTTTKPPTDTTTVLPPPTTTPTTGTTLHVEAESYVSMSGVQKENCYDAGGGQDVGYIDMNDWMQYSVTLSSAGTYTMNFRIATEMTGAQILVKNGAGTTLATVAIPNTAGYQTWRTVTASVTLPSGTQTIRLQSANASMWNINWFEIVPSNPAPAPTAATTGSFKLEAENYTAMSGVQTETTYDVGGGKDVGWIDMGDWMDFSVNPATTTTYTLNLRIATEMTGAQIQIRKSNGTVLQTVTVPNTAGYQTWRTITTTITLPAGLQTIRLVSMNASMWNINWLEFIPTTSPAMAFRGINSTILEQGAANEVAVAVYPNPVRDRLQVQMNNEYRGRVILQILRMDGSVVRQQQVNKPSDRIVSEFNLGNLQKGTYILRMTMDGWTESKQIIKF